jgi:GTP cyclohydrolase I
MKKNKRLSSASDTPDKIVGYAHSILAELGENPKREGLIKTPKRVAASLRYLTSGYDMSVEQIMNRAIFHESYDEMVVVKDIDLFSLCEHHMLPFYGKCHVAYIPNGKIIGLSKIPRIVNIFMRRLQVQERLTTQIAECLMSALKPHGVGVVVEAQHLCMAMRGVEKQRATCTTSSLLGSFRSDRGTRMEFMNLIQARSDR